MWRSALVKNFKGMEQYDWLRNGFFTGGCLHYAQDFYGGGLQAWMKKWHGCLSTWQFFLLEEFSGGQVYWATSNHERINLTSKEFRFITLFSCMIVFHYVFNIWHRPPLPYFYGNKLKKEGESDANTNMVMLVWIIRILWIVLLFSIMELIWIIILGNSTGMSNVSYEDSWDEQIIIAYSAMSITPPKFPSFAQMYE